MRKLFLIAAAGSALLAAGCATNGAYYGGGYGYNSGISGDVWYDGYYGPYADGYWGDGDAFFFRGVDGHYYRDRASHFRNQSFSGAQHFTAGHRRH